MSSKFYEVNATVIGICLVPISHPKLINRSLTSYREKKPSKCLIKLKKALLTAQCDVYNVTMWTVIHITDTDVEVVSYRLHALWKGRSTTQERNILNT